MDPGELGQQGIAFDGEHDALSPLVDGVGDAVHEAGVDGAVDQLGDGVVAQEQRLGEVTADGGEMVGIIARGDLLLEDIADDDPLIDHASGDVATVHPPIQHSAPCT